MGEVLGLERVVDRRTGDRRPPTSPPVEPLRLVEARCRSLLSRLPSEAFVSHLTAARLWGAPVPAELANPGPGVVDLGMPAPARGPHGTGIRGHRLVIDPSDIAEHRGLRITSPARTWIDVAALLPLPELVAVGDAFLRQTAAGTSRAALAARLACRPPRHSGEKLRRALALLSEHSSSRAESVLRVIVAQADLPPPVVLGSSERRLDLLWQHARLVVEVRTPSHPDPRQLRIDRERHRELASAGYRVLQATELDLREPALLLHRLERALRAAPRRSIPVGGLLGDPLR